MNGSQFKFVDLFAGIGGFHHALAELGGECVLAVERDDDCQQVYRQAFTSTRLDSDIRAITRCADGTDQSLEDVDAQVPDHDVLCAGFPCQPFSKSGFQKGVRDRTRGTLFHDVMTIVLAKKPEFVMLENVRNLAGPRHRDTWRDIIDSLKGEGYRVSTEPLVLSPHRLSKEDGGAPQVRDRVFILAYRLSRPEKLGYEPLLSRDLSPGWDPDCWRIEDYLDDDDSIENLANYQLRDAEQTWVEAWQAFVERIKSDRLPGFPIWVDAFESKLRIPTDTPTWKANFLKQNSTFYDEHKDVIDDWFVERWGPDGLTVKDFPQSRRKLEWQARKVQPTRSDRDLSKLVLQFRPSGIRVKPATYLPALVAITQTSVIGSRMRRITPREAARLQGLPTDLFAEAEIGDTAAYKQLGNAVNVGVVKAAARALFGAGNATWLAAPPVELHRVV
ncbi:MAG: DNA (cytosine-5-)-methyltransferase [Acidimicrobiales bacterium]|nr:DNA (cytosine-5-)-methyltransferase [Acidimicrobiales bacterium]